MPLLLVAICQSRYRVLRYPRLVVVRCRPALVRTHPRTDTITGMPAQAPARSLERRRRPDRLDDRVRHLPIARRHRRQAAGSAPAHGGLGRRRAVRAVRRAHPGRAVGRVSRDRRDVRLHPRGLGPTARPFFSAGPSSCSSAPPRSARSARPSPSICCASSASIRRRAVHATTCTTSPRSPSCSPRRSTTSACGGARSSSTSRRSPSTAGCCSSSLLAFIARAAAYRRALHAGRAAGLVPRRRVRARARLRALGVRRMGRSVVRLRRGEGSAARAAARDHPRHAAPSSRSICSPTSRYLAVMTVDEIRHSQARRGRRRAAAHRCARRRCSSRTP